MTLSYVSINANDGSIIADLPTLIIGGALKRTIGRAETQTATLPLKGAPENWAAATREKATFLIALNEAEAPIWGGMVTEQTTTHKSGVELALTTAEDYFADRWVGDETFTGISQNNIVKTLVEKYAKTGTKPGLPIRVQFLPGADPLRDRAYLDADDKTLSSVLEELSGVIGGPEWTIGWEWNAGKITPVLYVGERLGAAAPAGLNPGAQFYLPGNVEDAKLVKSFKRGQGANDVMATSSGAGGARPQSPRQTNAGDLRPTIEYRWSPSSSITNIGTLTAHAQRALSGMRDGTVALSITATRKKRPILGQEWDLGDDIGFDLTGPAWPKGITGTARVLSIELTDTTVTPVLDVSSIEGISS